MTRTRPDRCPGITRPWPADDGGVLRVRLPGGRVAAPALTALADVADDLGDGHLHLTSRANVQIRGVRDDAAAADRIAGAGLLPSPAHDLVRNIVCTPLTGLAGGVADLRGVLADLDTALLADDALAALPGKFLFLLDDGRGDVVGASHDLGAVATGPDRALVLIDGRAHRDVVLADVVPALIALAHRFLAVRGEGRSAAWHVHELAHGRDELGATTPVPLPQAAPPLPGSLAQDDGRWAYHRTWPDGVVPSAGVREIISLATELVVTPWRGLIATNLKHRPEDLA
ncbi:precorrin-3B synthase [Luteipulveratus sp. YIM 133132]|uniref:Precorrin-3B synthase n=1 Tax=Luteipulveratus flavus TaxID=3031728 RepID=A0ABT6C811_9MICO|nr:MULTISPECIES: precorrin-3B synthase [unclassified Luteipulveratus]MDE9365226.1 precorrin-3B synthase [Luteipulveratus sp. YIM 133132]MDF8264437.1 precorrin-3B synthase [Luteipulveratus sp. YIM 133296]